MYFNAKMQVDGFLHGEMIMQDLSLAPGSMVEATIEQVENLVCEIMEYNGCTVEKIEMGGVPGLNHAVLLIFKQQIMGADLDWGGILLDGFDNGITWFSTYLGAVEEWKEHYQGMLNKLPEKISEKFPKPDDIVQAETEAVRDVEIAQKIQDHLGEEFAEQFKKHNIQILNRALIYRQLKGWMKIGKTRPRVKDCMAEFPKHKEYQDKDGKPDKDKIPSRQLVSKILREGFDGLYEEILRNY